MGRLSRFIEGTTSNIMKRAENHRRLMKIIIRVIALLLLVAYLVYACVRHIDQVGPVLGISIFTALAYVYSKLSNKFGNEVWERAGKPAAEYTRGFWEQHRWPLFIVILLGLAVAFFFLIRDNPKKIVSALGLLVFILLTYAFSKHRRQVEWTPVVWGLALQVIFGFLILRADFGFIAFSWLGDLVQTVLSFSDKGADFLFGSDPCPGPYFAFRVLPVVLYFSSIIAVMYHLGVMQAVVSKIAWLMQHTMKTSASESLNAAGNIFIGQTEAPLLIQPLIKDMTKSELHSLMTGGFATIAGSVLGAYVAFGISSSHLLSASVMSAPAALAISKLLYPETELSSTRRVDQVNLPKSEHRNVIEAASYGAYTAIPLVLNMGGNLVAFLALLALFDGVLGHLGALIDIPELNFMFICGYMFMPVAWLMGVDPEDCKIVAELIGSKTFINEFYAYEQLAELIRNRLNGIEPYLSVRSEVIATYALCGFANIGSVGVQLGCLTAMAPSRKKDLANLSIRALIAGTVACFMTACVAGVLYDESTYDGGSFMTRSPCDPPLITTAEHMPTTNVMSTQGAMVPSDLTTAIDAIHTSGHESTFGPISASHSQTTSETKTFMIPEVPTTYHHAPPTMPPHAPLIMSSHAPTADPPHDPPTIPLHGHHSRTAKLPHVPRTAPQDAHPTVGGHTKTTLPLHGNHVPTTESQNSPSTLSDQVPPTVNQAHGAPANPAHDTPTTLSHGAPANPAHDTPTTLSHGAPADPAHGTSDHLAHSPPTTLAHGAPADPAHGAPTDPAHVPPITPVHGAPDNPAHDPPSHG